MYPARSKWIQIGIQLGLESSTLEAIEHKWPRDDGGKCLCEVLREWLNQQRGSREALLAALRAESVGEPRLADDLEESSASVCFNFVIHQFVPVHKIIPIYLGKTQVQSSNVTSMQKITTVNVSAETVIMPQTGSTVTVVTHQSQAIGMCHDMQSSRSCVMTTLTRSHTQCHACRPPY